ncbi:hypothetical protein PTKIN_Ptkin17bG0169400 [Pterospermum kingtungense]
MAVHCKSVPFSCQTWRNRAHRPFSTLLPTRLFSVPQNPFSFHSHALKFATRRWDRVVSAVVSEESAVGSSSFGTDVFKLTYLEVTYLEPGQESEVEAGNGSKVRIQATAGPVLGPPWQRPENGYLIISPKWTLYYEPHCVYNKNFLEKEHADIVITPVIKQLLPNFTLVSGQEDAVQLAKLLHAKFIVPMKNGDLDSKGILTSIIKSEGTVESFKELLSKELPDAQALEPTPGVPLRIPPP